MRGVSVRVVLRNNAIFVQSGSDTLDEAWMDEFFDHHIDNTLFLDNGVLVLNNEQRSDKKGEFLDALSEEYTKANDLSSPFYRRSLRKCRSAAIRIEVPYKEEEEVGVEVYAYNPTRVKLAFDEPNRWLMRFLSQQLSPFVLSSSSSMIYIDVTTQKAKSRLEKVLNRKEVLHYKITYRYDEYFMSRLYGQYQGWGQSNDAVDRLIRYYAIFELPVGSTPKNPQDLKKRYLQLAKRYHPDRIQSDNPEVINTYTQKFQLLQEAYDALKTAS